MFQHLFIFLIKQAVMKVDLEKIMYFRSFPHYVQSCWKCKPH